MQVFQMPRWARAVGEEKLCEDMMAECVPDFEMT